MEAAGDMFNLSMGPPEMPEPHRQDKPNTSRSSTAPSDDEQFNDMFKVPPKVLECQDQVPVTQSGLYFRALMAEAQFKSSWRVLPPPLELRLHHKDDKDTRNMELQAKTSKRIEVPVSNPRNKDPLDLDRDTNWDAVLGICGRDVKRNHAQVALHQDLVVPVKGTGAPPSLEMRSILRREVRLPTGNIQRLTRGIPRHAKKAWHQHASSP